MKAILFASFLVASTVFAASPTVEQVLDYYHTREFLDQAMNQMEEALQRRRKETTVAEPLAVQMMAMARKIYRPDNLMEVFKVAYAKAISLEQMQAVAAWQVSVKGLILRRGINDFYTKRNPAPPPEGTVNRRNAISTFVMANELDDLFMALMLGADWGVWMAIEASQPPQNRESVKFITEKIKARKTGYSATARAKAANYSVEILKKLKNDEIDELSKFASSPAGQGSTRAYRRALELTMERAGQTLAKQLQVTGG